MIYLEVALRTAAIVAVVVILTRINGLRSFTKMTSFDFALTVATGSLLAATILATSRSLLIGAAALVSVFAVQQLIARLRIHVDWFQNATENQPILLMKDGVIIEDNLEEAQVTRGDLFGKLREANVLSLEQVRAVVLEATGDVSVLHSADRALEPELLEGVRVQH